MDEQEEDSASGAVLFKSDLGRKCEVPGGLRDAAEYRVKLARIFFRIIPRDWVCKTDVRYMYRVGVIEFYRANEECLEMRSNVVYFVENFTLYRGRAFGLS